MFKNAIIYRISSLTANQDVESSLQAHAFIPCGASQEQCSGWVPPRGEAHGPLLEIIGGQRILKLMTETKAVPGAVIKRKTDERIQQIHALTGRKPGKKETREIKEDIKLELLPMAFAKQASTLVWLDLVAGLLLIDAASQAKADDAVRALLSSVAGLELHLISTVSHPASAMSGWLIDQEPPAGFTVDRECELKATDESKASIKYGRHPLDIDEVKAHVEGGMSPVKLALTWDSRVSFVLTEGLQLKKLTFLDVVFDKSAGAESGFDADVAIATGELRKMLPDLLDALGGEVAGQPEAQSDSTSAPAPHRGSDVDGPDPLYDQAVAVMNAHGKPSISLVQRYLKIGYNRAARLLEDMERAGIVSAMDGSGQRTILKAGAPA